MKSYRIVNHGIEHSQYFQGHGVSFTRYTDCATGIGNTAGDALDDALEQLCMSGTITSEEGDAIGASEDAAILYANQHTAHADCDPENHEECELYWHVSVDVEW